MQVVLRCTLRQRRQSVAGVALTLMGGLVHHCSLLGTFSRMTLNFVMKNKHARQWQLGCGAKCTPALPSVPMMPKRMPKHARPQWPTYEAVVRLPRNIWAYMAGGLPGRRKRRGWILKMP